MNGGACLLNQPIKQCLEAGILLRQLLRMEL